MTNPMIEKVAQAICGNNNPNNVLEIHRIRARAAIEAMREVPNVCYDNYVCDKIWKEMNSTEVFNKWIDAALKDV